MSFSSIRLYAKPMVLNPAKDSYLTVSRNVAFLLIELRMTLSGAPFKNTYTLFSVTSFTSTDIDWNFDSNWLIRRICSLLSLLSTINFISLLLLWLIWYLEVKYISLSISSPNNFPSISFTVWQEANNFIIKLWEGSWILSVTSSTFSPSTR